MIRAVVVRPPADEQDERWTRRILLYLDRHGQQLVGFADVGGAFAMVANGTADVIVAAKASHVELPAFVELLSDELLNPDPGPQQRRPRRSQPGVTHRRRPLRQ